MNPSLLVYLIKTNFKSMSNTKLELEWSKTLSYSRAREYLFTRGHARYLLSIIHNIAAEDVPLTSAPGKAPRLKNGLGFISISHCKNCSLIGWSKYPIGVDIEIKNRKFFAKRILNKYYSPKEKSFLLKHDLSTLKEKVLDYWLIKESSFKLRGGNLISELNNLEVNEDKKTVFNKRLQTINNYLLMNFFDWKIAISFDTNIMLEKPLICYSN